MSTEEALGFSIIFMAFVCCLFSVGFCVGMSSEFNKRLDAMESKLDQLLRKDRT